MRRNCLAILVISASVAWIAGCASRRPALPPPEVVASVDLARYMGRWYEIARFPNRFQKGCDGSTASYSLRRDGRVAVVNRCYEVAGGHRERSVRGTAKVVDPVTRAKLSVTFFWPFSGDYWILALDEGYRWAVVGSPDRKYLWILSRTPSMEEGDYRKAVGSAASAGFDTARLVRARHDTTIEGTRAE